MEFINNLFSLNIGLNFWMGEYNANIMNPELNLKVQLVLFSVFSFNCTFNNLNVAMFLKS